MRRILVILAGLASAATPSMADSDVEHARYSVITTDGPIEIREYAPQIVAETTIAGEREEAIREGFRRLAGYIFGDNAPREKVAMTAPVVQSPKGEKIAMTAPVDQSSDGTGANAWRVRFTMPAEYELSSLPQPNNSAVRLSELPAKRVAAIRFSGLASEGDLVENERKLLDFARAQRLTIVGSPHYAFYDPPWTLPWNRRNEVMVEIGR
jgi:effector-binding domain-containing protein